LYDEQVEQVRVNITEPTWAAAGQEPEFRERAEKQAPARRGNAVRPS
jgi:hypothetical protein